MDAEVIRNELIAVAEVRLDRYRRLLSLAEEQRGILLAGRHAELVGNLANHDPVLAELAQLDRREEMLLARLNEAGDPSALSPDFEGKHQRIAEQTSEAATRLRSIVQGNAQLLANAMDFVSFSIGILSKLAADLPSYDPSAEAANPALVFDRKV
jgi:hypothetical protein